MTLQRNPFSRQELVRELVPMDERGECSWCCSRGKFRYGIEADGLYTRTNWLQGEFCSIGCCRAYHDMDEEF